MADRPVLGYWHIRGLAEGIRYLLDYLNVDFDDHPYIQGPAPDYDASSWYSNIEGLHMDFPNLPYLVHGDLKISETQAIYDYISSQYGPALCGESVKERAVVRQLGGILHDIKWWLAGECYSPSFHEKKVSTLADARSELQKLIKFLGDKHFLTGERITWPDFIFFETLEMLNAIHPGFVAETEPKLEVYRARIAALPQLQRRITGQRLPWNNTQATWN